MWHSPHRPHQQCQHSMEQFDQQPQQQHVASPTSIHSLSSFHRCARRPFLKFPPPPKHPPPMCDDPDAPGPSSGRRADCWPEYHHHHHYPNDYSYAYYEPGPPARHTNVPYKEGTYHARHTYLTRYGTEENIYEEVARYADQGSVLSLHQSLVEEEVRRVQSGHRRVLGELNLSVEAMIMPSGQRDDDANGETDDQLADLLTVGPTDDLLSPMPGADLDSGFSGSSSGASYRSAAGSLRRNNNCDRPKSSNSGRVSAGTEPAKGFWGKKAWKKIASFPSNISLNKPKDESRVPTSPWDESACDRRVPPPLNHSRTLQHTLSQRSSEDSWCSGSDHELSSDDESDRSANSSNRSNGQLRNTLHKALTLCDKLRSGNRASLDEFQANQGRLSRWFSIRRGSAHHYDVENPAAAAAAAQEPKSPNKMPLLTEVGQVEEEHNFLGCSMSRRQLPPTLPPPPANLTPQQLKRRMIVAAIVHSENSYVATLQRLVNDYKKPLEENSPPILSSSKIATLFHRLPEILQCHTLFRIALAECIRNWDSEEKIGDVFVASFSKAIVLDIYSGFINNFSIAMDLAKMEAKRKSALADFLKVKQISSHDRLSFFGLMVKPVQRFPQFILFLQDLLKHTPQGHHDRMSLQLALTQLESLAEMLNERKREAEQYQAFKEMLRNISGKFSARPLSDGNRYLLREDNVTQIEYNQNGLITKTKSRRLLLLNDLVVCVSVSPKVSDDFGSSERLSLKWTYPVTDVEIQDTSSSPTLSRVLTAGLNKGGSLKSNSSLEGSQPQEANNLCTEMSDLMHDYEAISRISDLLGTLKGEYKDLSAENARKILHQIQSSIQQKDEEIAWMDSCCLQLVIKSKGKEEQITFQTDSPGIKKDWITELRLAQLALDPSNSPAWEVPEQEQRPSTKMPLFVKSQCVYRSQHQTEVRCGCYYTLNIPKSPKRRHHSLNYLWVCTSNGTSSHVTVLSQHHQQSGVLKDVTAFALPELEVTTMEFVKGVQGNAESTTASESVWMGTKSHRLLIYSARDPERQEQIGSAAVSDSINEIKYHCDNVFVALSNGTLVVYRRNQNYCWELESPQILTLGTDPVTSVLPINLNIYASCEKKVFVLNANTGELQKSFYVHEHPGNVNLMAHSGIGLWISLKHSSTICLYHTETFKHLQDINIASNVTRVTNRSQVNVTALLACKGLLWVGTNVGIILTIPLPRLEGVPIISGRVNISYHSHFGPISFLLALQPKNYTTKIREPSQVEVEVHMERKIEKQLSDSSSPIRRRSDIRSKTLPRCFNLSSSTSSQSSEDACNVYGLYGELMYLKDYENEEEYESTRRSDPELAIPSKVSTLDRRLKMKVSRPRSLDLSNWSVDSRSSSLFTSSGSEESMAKKSVSRNSSNVSRQLNDVCELTATKSVKTLTKNVPDNARRTVITIMGGRGYVNWRQPCCDRKSVRDPNSNDAHLVIWELKL